MSDLILLLIIVGIVIAIAICMGSPNKKPHNHPTDDNCSCGKHHKD